MKNHILILCLLAASSFGAVGVFKNPAGTSGVLTETVKADDTHTIDFANTALKVRDTNASHSLIFAPGSNITADRTLSFVSGDADRSMTMGGNWSTAGAFTLSGAYDFTGTLTGATSVTFPTSGTLLSSADIGSSVQAYDADLTSIAGNTTGGFLTRTASNTYTARTITGTSNEITVTNGDGVSGAPTLSLPSSLTFTGKTITGGTFASPTLSGTLGGSGTIGGSTIINTSGAITGAAITGTTGTFSGAVTMATDSLVKATSANANLAIDSQGGSGRQWVLSSRTDGTFKLRDATGGSDLYSFSTTGLAVTGQSTATLFRANGGANDGRFDGAFTGAMSGLSLTSSDDATDTYFAVFRKSNDTPIGTIRRSGTSDAVVFNTTSTESAKRDIVPMPEDEVVAAVEAAQAYLWNWRSDGSPDGGMVAQRLAASHPLWTRVHAVKLGNDTGLDYMAFQARRDRITTRAKANEAAKVEHAQAVKTAAEEAATAEESRKARLGPAKLALLAQKEQQEKLLAEMPADAKPADIAAAESNLAALAAEVSKIPAEDRAPVVATAVPEPEMQTDPEDSIPDPILSTVSHERMVPVLLAYSQHLKKELDKTNTALAALAARVEALENK